MNKRDCEARGFGVNLIKVPHGRVRARLAGIRNTPLITAEHWRSLVKALKLTTGGQTEWQTGNGTCEALRVKLKNSSRVTNLSHFVPEPILAVHIPQKVFL